MLFISLQKLFSFSRYKFLSSLFDHVSKQLDYKKVNFKFCDVTAWLTNYFNTHVTQYLENKSNQTMKFDQLIEGNKRNIFLEKSYTKFGGEFSPRPFPEKYNLSISLEQ